MKKNLRKADGFVLILLVIAIFWQFFANCVTYAQKETNVSILQNVSLNLNGSNYKFSIKRYLDGEIDMTHGSTKFQLTGFLDDVSLCAQQKVNIKGNDYICLTGVNGAHSQNLQLLWFDGSDFRSVQFAFGGVLTENISTDLPNFQFQNNNSDLIVDYRDYDTDPLKNAIRQHFKFDNQQFVFDSQDNISYH